MRITIALAILGILLTGCGFTGGFGRSTDEALQAQVPFTASEEEIIQVKPETFKILQASFLQSDAYMEKRPEVLETLGGISMWYKFLKNQVGTDKSLDYGVYVTSYKFLNWLCNDNLAELLDPLVADGELSDSRDSLIYYLTSQGIKEKLNEMGARIALVEHDIRSKASANDAAELRALFKKISPFMKIMAPGIGGLGGLL